MQSRVLSACLLLASTLLASDAIASPNTTSDVEAIRQLSSQWMTAIEKKDRKSLEKILADNYVLQMPGDAADQYVHRAEWINNAINLDWTGFRYENLVVRVHGDHATVSSRLFFKVSPNPLTFDSGVLDTWERRNGEWRVTTRYLGESQLKERVSFVLGALAAALALGAAYLIARLSARAPKRAV